MSIFAPKFASLDQKKNLKNKNSVIFYLLICAKIIYKTIKNKKSILKYRAKCLCPFNPISGKQEFLIKIRLCHFLAIMDAYHHAKNQKKLMKQF